MTPDVSRETQERLRVYAALLERWSRRINLVSPRDLPHLWERHIRDSLQLLTHLPGTASHAIDLGSGGGFPGLVLAIASGLPFHLVEADQRKAAFLREAARETQASATVHATRIESVRLSPAPVVTARALAPLPRLLELAAPLLTEDGLLLALKGETAPAELTDAERQWHMRIERVPSGTHPTACILKIREPRRVIHQP